MDYVLEKVPPPRPGLPHPRFSLYLSSQLQYGVVVVFHRQCAILLGKMLLADVRDGNAAMCAASLPQPSWFSRGASVHRGAAGETEDVAEDRFGRAEQARTAAQHFIHFT